MRQQALISAFCITVLALICYANTLHGPFIWDDSELIEKNAHIRQASGIPHLFSGNIGAGAGVKYRFYRPLQGLTYALDYSFWRLNPFGYHLQNIVWHIAAAFCIWYLMLLLFKDNVLSLMTAFFFVVHPVHTEAVSYISGRADPLSLTFMLLTFIYYIKSRPFLSSIFFACALLARENALILPFLILLHHYTFRKKVPLFRIGALFVFAIVYVAARTTLLKALLENIIYPLDLWQRIPGFFAALFQHLSKLFVPMRLHAEYGLAPSSSIHPHVLMGASLFAIFLSCAALARRRRGVIYFGIGWFFISLIPTSNIAYPVNAYMAEHWLYLPSIGFFLAVSQGLRTLYCTKERGTLAALYLATALILSYSALTIRHNPYWTDPATFYARTLQYAPQSARAHINYGIFLEESGRLADAISIFKKALAIDPKNPEIYNNLGIAYAKLSDYTKAMACYRKALTLRPAYANASYNLGTAYADLRQYDAAISAYQDAARARPFDERTYTNLGSVYWTIGKKDEAIDAFKKAISINPHHPNAYYNLGVAYRARGDEKKANEYHEKARSLER